MKKNVIIVSLSALLVFIAIASFIVMPAFKRTRLTAYQISELRTQYPLIDDSHDAFLQPLFTLEESINFNDIFVMIEITEKLPDYTISFVTVDNIEEELLFHQYRAKIIKTYVNKTNDTFDDGYVAIAFADIFKERFPNFQVGSKAITSLDNLEALHTGKYAIAENTYYYITDTNHVISAYDKGSFEDYSGYSLKELEGAIDNAKAVKSREESPVQ